MKNNIQKIAIGGLCLILSQLIFQVAVMAHNKVVVVPLGGDKKPENVISVAKENGDFTDPVAAINSFSDESAKNRYLIIIGPGLYHLNETLVMRPYIDIVGSGYSVGGINSKLWGLISSSSVSGIFSIIQGANDSSVSNLRVENGCGENAYCSGISNDGASPTLFNMRVMTHGSDNQYGIYNTNFSSPLLTNININVQGTNRAQSMGVSNIQNSTPTLNNIQMTISGADLNVGIYTSSSSSADISDSTIYVIQSDATNNYGVISNNNSTSVISDTSITVGPGITNSGVRNSNSSSSILLNATVFAYSGTSKGVVNSSSASYATIRNSSVIGGTNSVDASSGLDPKETRIVDSELTGPVSGDPKCWSVTSGTATLDVNCQ